MIRILMAPSLIFISPQAWESDFGRDSALQLLLDYLDEIADLNLTALWSDELEALLWSDPVLPPWRIDRDWRVKLVPVIAKRFWAATTVLSTSAACKPSGFQPPGSLRLVRADIDGAFSRLSHQAALELTELLLCLDGAYDAQPPVSFLCKTCAFDRTVNSVTSPRDLASQPEIADEFWSSAQVISSADVDHLLNLVLRWQGGGSSAYYRTKCTSSFVAALSLAANKATIFEALAR